MAHVSFGASLPENVTREGVEGVYARMLQYKQGWGGRSETDMPWTGPWTARRYARTLQRARNAVIDRHPLVMLYLEKGADVLQKINDEQRARFSQEGHEEYARRSGEFMEFQVWRSAYTCADKGAESIYREIDLYRWVYMAIVDSVMGPL